MRAFLVFFLAIVTSTLASFGQGAPISKDMDIKPAELADRKSKYQQAEKARSSGDLPRAARLYREVVEAALTSTSLNFDEGLNYAEGAEPVKWFRKLAESGNVDAQFLLGRAYSRGRTVPVNHTEAFKWFVKAANQGDGEAQYEAGQACQVGNGVKQSNLEAKKWWKKAAAQGHERAQFKLDKMASKGD